MTSNAGESGLGESTWHLKPSRAAASASMRPSWPPPRIPMVASGLSTSVLRMGRDRIGLRRAPGVEALAEAGIGQGEHRRSEQRGIDGASLADRERADRD